MLSADSDTELRNIMLRDGIKADMGEALKEHIREARSLRVESWKSFCQLHKALASPSLTDSERKDLQKKCKGRLYLYRTFGFYIKQITSSFGRLNLQRLRTMVVMDAAGMASLSALRARKSCNVEDLTTADLLELERGAGIVVCFPYSASA